MRNSKLKIRRLNSGLELESVSNLLNIKKEKLYKIEEGYLKLTLQIAVKLTKIYKCSIEELCKDIGLDVSIKRRGSNE